MRLPIDEWVFIQVESIFKIERQGERERWEGWVGGWKGEMERMLLWHGSRSTNFAGEYRDVSYRLSNSVHRKVNRLIV